MGARPLTLLWTPVPLLPSALSRSAARSLGGFGGSVLVNGLVSVAAVPVVIASAGASLWAGIAVAQSIASFVGVVITFGWAVTGPATVAGLDPSARGAYFRDSLASRLWLALAGAPVTVLLVVLLTPGEPFANSLAALALLAPAAGASWFFVGERAPGRLLLCDTLPRAVGTAVGAVLLISLHLPLAVFAGCQAAGAIAAASIGALSVLRRHPGRLRLSLGADLRRLRSQTSGVVTAVTAALYVNLPVVLAGVLLPQQVALYAIADKLQKLALTAIGPVFQVSQGMVGGAPEPQRAQRAASVSRLAVMFGVAVAVGFAVLGQPGVALLSGGRVAPPVAVTVSLGIALGAIAVSAVIGLSCLTALGAVRQVATSTVAGAVVGVPLIVAGGLVFGISGIAIAAALSEVLVTVYQLVVLRRRISASQPLHPVSPLLGSPAS